METDQFEPWRRLGETLQHHRARRGMSVAKAAVAAGISESVWRQLEKGERRVGSEILPPNPRTETVVDAARAVGLDINDALSIIGRPPIKDEPPRTPPPPAKQAVPDLDELSRLVERLEAAVEALTAIPRTDDRFGESLLAS